MPITLSLNDRSRDREASGERPHYTDEEVGNNPCYRDEKTADEESRQPIPADPFQNFI
jgi:hypothetical protein